MHNILTADHSYNRKHKTAFMIGNTIPTKHIPYHLL